MRRLVRTLFLLLLVTVVFAVIGNIIVTGDKARLQADYEFRVTLAVQTAIAGALFEATRTVEVAEPQFRLVEMGPGEPLASVAERWHTTAEVIRIANDLLPSVDFADGGEILIVPEGVVNLDPPRSFETYTALAGDTLEMLATRFEVPLEILQQDNPILARRGLIPGDIVFVAQLF